MPLNTSVFGQFDFNGDWQSGGVSIINGDIYAQTAYLVNITGLNVSNLNINGSLLSQAGFDNTFDIGNASLRWRDLWIGRNAYFNGKVGIGTSTPVELVEIGDSANTDLVGGNTVVIGDSNEDANLLLTEGTTFSWGWIKWDMSDNDLHLYTRVNSVNNDNQLVLDSSGKVGIGTASPSSLFEIGKVADTNEVNLSGVLYVNSTSGKVGIGTASPSNILHISSENEVSVIASEIASDTSWHRPDIAFLRSRGSISSKSTVELNDNIALMRFRAYNGSEYSFSAEIRSDVDGSSPYSGYVPGRLMFHTGNGTFLAPQERMRIDSSGNVGIGTTGPLSKLSVGDVGNANYAIYGSGGISGTGVYGYGAYGIYGSATGDGSVAVYGNSGGGLNAFGVYGICGGGGCTGVRGSAPSGNYDFYAAGAGTDYGTSSSIRWKDNITEISNALDKVLNLRGVNYNWKIYNGTPHDMGFIAEEVGKVVPEIVGYDDPVNESNWYLDEEGVKKLYATGVDYGALTPLLVEAIKEQQTQMKHCNLKITCLNKNSAKKTTFILGVKAITHRHRVRKGKIKTFLS